MSFGLPVLQFGHALNVPDRLRSGMRPPAPQAGAFAPTTGGRIPLSCFEVPHFRSVQEVTP